MPHVTIHVKVSKDEESPFVHFWIVPEDEVGYNDQEKMVVIPPIEEQNLWKDVSDFLDMKTNIQHFFQKNMRTESGFVAKIRPMRTFVSKELVAELQKFFDKKYPAYNSM